MGYELHFISSSQKMGGALGGHVQVSRQAHRQRENADLEPRLAAAVTAAPYMRAKLKQLEVGGQGEPIAIPLGDLPERRQRFLATRGLY